ncbi:RNA polymerase sigma factor, sigma-70 family [Thiomonas bhubaneswarensis]|uniref:RNA polymerase sigma factor, sigma-70 family n=1 Tax=Thiomonas bhubaneswarensis TaxID=339866 RepID=A0A0K6I907_9BURK|nr:RNA polymerase sigma factor, sigma-70 family [Thiomonas bhubaneswarensis]
MTDATLIDSTELNRFCAEVRVRATRMALIELRDAALAADVVQDSLLKLVSNYKSRPADEWAPLFYSILRNRITDMHRRRKVEKIFDFFFSSDEEEDQAPGWEQIADEALGPEQQIANGQLAGRIADAISTLSPRQREAFLLREMEGLSIVDTAAAMKVSEGSVKTHHMRALTRLRELLESDHPAKV